MKEKNIWVLTIFILSGLVIGGLLGKIAGEVEFLWWLDYGKSFGLESPIVIDLDVIKLSFSIWVKINVASIIGLILAMSIYKKI